MVVDVRVKCIISCFAADTMVTCAFKEESDARMHPGRFKQDISIGHC